MASILTKTRPQTTPTSFVAYKPHASGPPVGLPGSSSPRQPLPALPRRNGSSANGLQPTSNIPATPHGQRGLPISGHSGPSNIKPATSPMAGTSMGTSSLPKPNSQQMATQQKGKGKATSQVDRAATHLRTPSSGATHTEANLELRIKQTRDLLQNYAKMPRENPTRAAGMEKARAQLEMDVQSLKKRREQERFRLKKQLDARKGQVPPQAPSVSQSSLAQAQQALPQFNTIQKPASKPVVVPTQPKGFFGFMKG